MVIAFAEDGNVTPLPQGKAIGWGGTEVLILDKLAKQHDKGWVVPAAGTALSFLTVKYV
ncbi:hypothetical protein [Mesorhizobium sp. M0965]|uniref:hypothetical protein n=1 Tax=Mesorhizobium sp. M0965 TaxID=2957036 RepID=UPI003336ABB5